MRQPHSRRRPEEPVTANLNSKETYPAGPHSDGLNKTNGGYRLRDQLRDRTGTDDERDCGRPPQEELNPAHETGGNTNLRHPFTVRQRPRTAPGRDRWNETP